MVFFSLKKRLSGIADCNFEEFRGSFQQLHDVLWFNSFLALPVIPSTREFHIINSNYYQHTFPKNSLDAWPSSVCHKTCKKRSSATLVLDLDETLVHSSEFSCNADFTFKMKSRTIYVKKRPYLEEFLEKVSEMFEVVIFTASTRSYSAKLLDILDPHNKFFSRRLYRDSCKWEDGHCLKDLRLLGIDMAKVFIIDNTPRVFRLHVNNGIPIKSWYWDCRDHALRNLLPLLEKLVDVDDVRPIIAARFWNRIKSAPPSPAHIRRKILLRNSF